jgi:hypothetical protein
MRKICMTASWFSSCMAITLLALSVILVPTGLALGDDGGVSDDMCAGVDADAATAPDPWWCVCCACERNFPPCDNYKCVSGIILACKDNCPCHRYALPICTGGNEAF